MQCNVLKCSMKCNVDDTYKCSKIGCTIVNTKYCFVYQNTFVQFSQAQEHKLVASLRKPDP